MTRQESSFYRYDYGVCAEVSAANLEVRGCYACCGTLIADSKILNFLNHMRGDHLNVSDRRKWQLKVETKQGILQRCHDSSRDAKKHTKNKTIQSNEFSRQFPSFCVMKHTHSACKEMRVSFSILRPQNRPNNCF